MTEYYKRRGIYVDERFDRTLDTVDINASKQSSAASNAMGLALLRYWEFAALNHHEIGQLAYRLYGIKVNSAPCERLFSRMGWFQSMRRSRLKVNIDILPQSHDYTSKYYSFKLCFVWHKSLLKWHGEDKMDEVKNLQELVTISPIDCDEIDVIRTDMNLGDECEEGRR